MKSVLAFLLVCSFGTLACSDSNSANGTEQTSGTSEIAFDTTSTAPTDTLTDSDCSFICNPNDQDMQCDVWTQNCPAGQKCMPWDNDGDFSWNATKCTDVAIDPDRMGEECTVQESGVSGIDSCEKGSMCYTTDGEGNGTCIPFCVGSPAEPQCQDPQDICSISANNGVLILCRPKCNPILQDCGAEKACLFAAGSDQFACIADASGEAGQAGDPCEFINSCDPGLFCANAEAIPNCQSSSGCCTAFCDLSGATDTCSDHLPNTQCVPWYATDEAPAGLENVGGCVQIG